MRAGQVKALANFAARSDDHANSVFREVVEALPVAIYTTDAEGRLTYFNAAATKLAGRIPELGHDFWCVTWKLFHPDGTPLPHDQCPMAIVLKGGEVPTGIECIAERPDGTRFWFTPSPSALRDADGRIIGAINMLVDITDRKKAEMDAREPFRAMVETTPDCVKIIAPDGTLLFINSAGAAMAGAPSAESAIGCSVYDLIVSEDKDRFRDFHERICRGARGSLHFDIIGREGIRRHLETHAAPLRQADGTTAHLAFTRNITARKQVDGALRESEERFRRVFEEGPLGVVLTGRDYRFLKVNSAFTQMVEYSETELLGKSFLDITHPDDLEMCEESAARLFRGEIPRFQTRKRYVTKNGEIIWINLTSTCIRDSEGQFLYGLGLLENITEVKRNQEEALAHQKLESLGVLARGIAHDFNNLLGAILSESELIDAELAAPREGIARIKTVVIRGAEIVRELMIFAGQDEDSVTEPVDLSRLAEEILVLLKVSVSKQVVLKIDLAKNLPAVLGKAPQIRQMLMNLVINASEAIGDKEGVIHVSTSLATRGWGLTAGNISDPPTGDCVRLEVSDNGCGMTEELKTRIFDPFFTTKFEGRGLGLSVVQRIVRDCGGRLDVLSVPGRGSIFQIFLPCTSTRTFENPAAVRFSGTEQLLPQTGTILFVEDEESIRRPVSKVLRKKGFSVMEANNGSTAIDLLGTFNGEIDLVLLDVTIPGKSSREVFEQAISVRPKLKVILTSAYSKDTIATSFTGLRITHFIRKPFQMGELADVLRDALGV